MIEVTAYCPTCGGRVVGKVSVTGVRMNGGEASVIVSLDSTVIIKHKCEKTPQDATDRGYDGETYRALRQR